MKINGIFNKQNLYNTERAGEAAKVGGDAAEAKRRAGLGSDDQVTISEEARLRQHAAAIRAEDDAVRAQRVEELKKQVADGTYQKPTSEELARAIVNYFNS